MSIRPIQTSLFQTTPNLTFGHKTPMLKPPHQHGANCGCGPGKLAPSKGVSLDGDTLSFKTKSEKTDEKPSVEAEKPIEAPKKAVVEEKASETSSKQPAGPKPGFWNHVKYYANAFKVWLTELWSGFWADLKLLFKASD